jgi:poly(3-hydroxybutyrate) depolymerase
MPTETKGAPMETPDENSITPQSSSTEVCVPLSVLAAPGEDDQMNNPAPGDVVQFQSEGQVTRIEGDNAYVNVQSVNGKPLTANDAKTKDTPEADNDQEFAALQQEAQARGSL